MILSLYEDPALVAEMKIQEALEEEEMLNAQIIPTGFEALISSLAQANAKPEKKRRVTLLSEARKALCAGKLPEPFLITGANTSYNNHLAKLYAFAAEGLRTALEDYPLSGTNTYARAVRGYRDILLEYLDTNSSAKSGASTHTPKSQPATPAKKVKAAKITAAKTKDAKPAKATKAPATATKARKAPVKAK